MDIKHFQGPGTRMRGPRIIKQGEVVVARTRTLTQAKKIRQPGQTIHLDPEASHVAPLR